MSEISLKLSNILRRMISVASQSTMASQHAAVLLKKGKVVSMGHNTIWRTSSVHAERRVVDLYLAAMGYKFETLSPSFRGFQKRQGDAQGNG